MVRVAPSLVSLARRPGEATSRQQFQLFEKQQAEAERKQLDRLKDPAARHVLKAEFTAARAARARAYAAVICSEAGWRPKPGASAKGQILTAFYARAGEKARHAAADGGRPFSVAELAKVRLSRDDVATLKDSLIERFGAKAIEDAFPLLQKHICHDSFLDSDALAYMASAEFLALRAAVISLVDEVEREIDAHDRQLAEDAHARLVDDMRTADKKRRILSMDGPPAVETRATPDGSRERRTYNLFGGRLVAIAREDD
jgi:hypothetical protein